MTPDERLFLTTQLFSEKLREYREDHGRDLTAIKCKAMIEAAYAELSTIEGEKKARLFIGGLTFARDPHGQSDYFPSAIFPTMG